MNGASMMNAAADAAGREEIRARAILAELVAGTRQLTGEIYNAGGGRRIVVDGADIVAYSSKDDKTGKRTAIASIPLDKLATIRKAAAEHYAMLEA